jgi:NAD-dependent DNA ligase
MCVLFLCRFLYSLGMRSVGLEMSRLILSADFKSFTLLWEYLTCEAEKLIANNSSSSSTGPDPLVVPIGEKHCARV